MSQGLDLGLCSHIMFQISPFLSLLRVYIAYKAGGPLHLFLGIFQGTAASVWHMISAEKRRRYCLKVNGWLWKHTSEKDPSLNRIHTFAILEHQFASEEEMEQAAIYMCATKAGKISTPFRTWKNVPAGF